MVACRLSVLLLAAITLAAGPAAVAQTTGAVSAAGRAQPASSDGARSALPAVVAAAHLSVDGPRTRLTFDLTRPVEMRAFALADPYRVIIDLDEVNFHIAPPAAERRGLVKTFRFGLFAPGKSRIVVELTGPAVV